jgi:hypothetical protein
MGSLGLRERPTFDQTNFLLGLFVENFVDGEWHDHFP